MREIIGMTMRPEPVKTNNRLRIVTVALAAVTLLLCALVLTASAHGQVPAEEQEFMRLWNETGARWNAATEDLNRGIMPRQKLKDLDGTIERLRRNKYWIKEKR